MVVAGKKLSNLKIDSYKFRNSLERKIKIKKVYNYYGLIEQTGSIFIECPNCKCFKTLIDIQKFLLEIKI